MTEVADQRFAELATEILGDFLRAQPGLATKLGDHRFDGDLPDLSVDGRAEFAQTLDDRLTQLDAVDDTELGHLGLLDLETLRAALAAASFDAVDIRRHTWDPTVWNPGDAIWQLVSREVLEPAELSRALTQRLASVPEWQAVGRDTLDDMSRIHVETAINQLEGTQRLLEFGLDRAIAGDAGLAPALIQARGVASEAVRQQRQWLIQRIANESGVGRDPRLGEAKFAATMWHLLGGGPDIESLHGYAVRALADTSAALTEVAAMLLNEPENSPGLVDRALAHVAATGHIDESTILAVASQALQSVTQFTRDNDLVTVYDEEIRVVEMPEIHRGVAVAYCDAPGPLEAKSLPTLFSVAPPPDAWSAERKASFYREYNAHALQSLAIHEGVPGHALQLAHSRRAAGCTPLRRALRNGAFVEGWALYAEELLASLEYPGLDVPEGQLALHLVWLKLRLRGIVNLLLDIGVHTHELTEGEGMYLLTEVAHQEHGEAIGKWRRALLTAGQLSTYFAGYLEVSGISSDLRMMHPEWGHREVHDTMLMFGSPSTGILRQALGLPEVLTQKS